MNNLLIDIGNSEIKIGKGILNKLNSVLIKSFPYSKQNFKKDFSKNFKFKPQFLFEKIGVSILKGGDKKFLSAYFVKEFKLRPVFIDEQMKLPIKINYKKGLGSDRICSAVAAYTLFKRNNILIIDFGTATTFTLVINGVLEGGLIVPGIVTSLNSLIEKTSLRRPLLKYPKKLICNNTLENINAGVLFQSLFSVERIIHEVEKMHKNIFVVATGGNSYLIRKKTKLINEFDSNLVLKGINILIQQ
ncbi:MAG: type III pantothenate kinase [Ignavibacteria bacterium]